MTVTFTELHESSGAELGRVQNALVGRGAVRRFISPGYSEAAAMSAARQAANGELEAGAPHPRISGLNLNGLRAVERSGADGWYLEANYTENGISQPRPADREDLGFTSTGLASEDGDLEVPIITRRYVVEPTSGEARPTWVGNVARIQYDKVRLTVQVNVPHFDPGDAAAIVTQSNKIHVIAGYGGTKWLFSGWNADQVSRDAWRIDYAWVAEPGITVLPLPEFDIPMLAIPLPLPPHARWVVGWGGSLQDPQPNIQILKPYDESQPGGYLSLPGQPFSGAVWQP